MLLKGVRVEGNILYMTEYLLNLTKLTNTCRKHKQERHFIEKQKIQRKESHRIGGRGGGIGVLLIVLTQGPYS